ncbi:hypothetical protein TNCV_3177951 [Trichonephila clavipes]|nr:hypothetical protein TNCV_3177951 [Trichonephila clavipes]
MERGSKIPWPPRSLDTAPLDFLLGYVKNIYKSPICKTDELEKSNYSGYSERRCYKAFPRKTVGDGGEEDP